MGKRFDDVQPSNKCNLRQYNFEHIRFMSHNTQCG